MHKKSTAPVFLLAMAVALTLMLLASGCASYKSQLKDEGETSKQAKEESVPLSEGEKPEKRVPEEEQVLYKIYRQMFPKINFSLQGSRMVAESGETYFVEQVNSGNFTGRGEEYLVIVRRPPEELAHAVGFYNSYLGIFDVQTRGLTSPVKFFSADEGSISLFKGKNRTFLFFAGSVTFQGWSEWKGELYQAAADQWHKVWPERENFWQDKAVQAGQDRIILYDKKMISQNGQGTIPEYQVVYKQELKWDPAKETFK